MKLGNYIRDITLNWLFKGSERGKSKMGSYHYDKNTEYNIWYKGEEYYLKEFYEEIDLETKYNYFYRNTYICERVVHSGLPRLIADTMARLVFSGGTDVEVEDNKQADETLDAILKDNKMKTQNNQAASLDSAFGKVAYKLSYDESVSKWVIIEVVKSTNFECITYKDRIQQINFFSKFYYMDKYYKLVEEYGKGFIDYKLYMNKKDEWVELSLSALPMTAELTRVEFDENIILAMVKTNKTIEGRSDYDGLISEFDSLDESISTFTEEVRLAKTDIYIPQRRLPNGSAQSRMVKKYIEIETSLDEEKKIQYEQPLLRTTEWSEAQLILINNILATVGLSPATIGLDTASANASGASRRELEKASLRTRAEKIEMWEEFLKEFYILVLQAQDIFTNKPTGEYEVNIVFGEYIVDTMEDRIKAAKDLILMGVIDSEFALDMIFGEEISEEVKVRILENLGEVIAED